MAPPKSNTTRKAPKEASSGREGKKPGDKRNTPSPRNAQSQARSQPQKKKQSTEAEEENENQIDISAVIPITLQQLLLNVFKTALLSAPSSSRSQDQPGDRTEDAEEKKGEEALDVKTLIQTIKSHLYNRDFDSAFADADEQLLRAYALRWSAARALGYAGLFKAILKVLVGDAAPAGGDSEEAGLNSTHVVCIGGGAGAEIVALAAAWRDLLDEEAGAIPGSSSTKEISNRMGAVSLDDTQHQTEKPEQEGQHLSPSPSLSSSSPSLSITAVDIADWSSIVNRLSATILSSKVPSSSKSHPAPLLTADPQNAAPSQSESEPEPDPRYNVSFKRLDVLSLSDSDLTSLFQTNTIQNKIVTLMFTLNELFSTSMPKATAFLLRTTDLLQKGTILLVVDSPGSYSTLKLGKAGAQQERQYPMKFLLDHTLLSVAKGRWERLYSQDSRWWRRDANRLWYEVGEGAGLEDMRFQIHIYRRI
ncbi:hypothetical protein BDV18DRAFT_118472 [Aspergillus unguis]